MLPSEARKFEKAKLVINGYSDIGEYRYFIDRNLSNWYYTVRVMNLKTREAKTLCTRGKAETALGKALQHIQAHK
jgi:hypothetical protein